MSEMFGYTATFQEAVWNFAYLENGKRITLSENPHFYLKLPTLNEEYGGEFKAFPVEVSRLQLEPDATIYVLIDQPRRVFPRN